MDALDVRAAGPVGMFCGRVVDVVGTDDVFGVPVEEGGGCCWLTGVDVPDPDVVVVFPTA